MRLTLLFIVLLFFEFLSPRDATWLTPGWYVVIAIMLFYAMVMDMAEAGGRK